MPIQVQRPPGINVGVSNPGTVLYITGNDTTDGSIRIILDDGDTIAHIELRASGVWNDTGFRFNSSSVEIGRDMIISAVAGHLETNNPTAVVGHVKGILPHVLFDDGGTGLLESGILNVEELFNVFTDAVGETVAPVIGIDLGEIPGRVIEHSFHEVGSVSATSEIQVSMYKGSDNTGLLFNRRNLPSSDMPANTTLDIDYDNDLGFEGGVSVFMEFASADGSDISLKTDGSGNALTIHEGHELDEVGVVTENLMLDENLNFMFDTSLNPMYAIQFP